MFFSISNKSNIFDRLTWILLILVPLISSCSSNQNNTVEIITPPILSNEFSSIPENTESAQLISLLPTSDKIKDIRVGRNNPFLPTQFEGNELSVPATFKYHGQLSSNNIIDAFVSFKNKSGTLRKGDIGGKNTDLLPTDWTVLKLDPYKQVLTLGFDSRSVEIDLFPRK
tara:strand:- start:2910 stop:3419 length:510 start_codon:yes stop_codon:yes gene_type:complete